MKYPPKINPDTLKSTPMGNGAAGTQRAPRLGSRVPDASPASKHLLKETNVSEKRKNNRTKKLVLTQLRCSLAKNKKPKTN